MTNRRRGAKRAFGEVSQLPSGRYRARFSLPGGQRISAPITFVARLDAEYWLGQQERAISRGEWEPPTPPTTKTNPDPEGGSALFGRYADQVIAERRIRPTTRALYEKLLRLSIRPTFGPRELASITAREVADWYRSQAHTPTQQSNAYGLLKSIFKEAVEDGLVDKNPCRIRGGAQKTTVKEIQVLDISQIDPYLLGVTNPQRRCVLALAVWCGLRSGEARGLRHGDLDLNKGVVHIRQAVVRIGGQLSISEPKTRAGVRTVSIPPHLIVQLKEWGCNPNPTTPHALLFPARDGRSPMNDGVLRTAHNQGKKAVAMPTLTVHALRHTGATLAAQMGATLAELQERIGHTTPGMAMRYQHAAASRDAALAAKMSALRNTQTTQPTKATTEASPRPEPTRPSD